MLSVSNANALSVCSMMLELMVRHDEKNEAAAKYSTRISENGRRIIGLNTRCRNTKLTKIAAFQVFASSR
jgi:hypothetical protein